jgi:hypothetical protein
MMSKMRPMMMQHMMVHAKAAATGGMSDCPMMQQMQAGASEE